LVKLILRISDYFLESEEAVKKGVADVMGGKVLQLESERLLAEGAARFAKLVEILLAQDKIEEVSGSLHKSIDDLVEALARVNGEDHHDWLRNLAKYLCVDVKILLEGLYDIWKKDNEEVIDAFTKALRDIVLE